MRGKYFAMLMLVLVAGGLAWWLWSTLGIQSEHAALTEKAKGIVAHSASSNAPAATDKAEPHSNPPDVKVVEQSQTPAVQAASSSSTASAAPSSPIRFAEGPPNGAEIILADAHELLHTDSPSLEAEPPLAKYTLSARGRLDSAQPAGFYYILEDSGNLAAGADIFDPYGTGAYRMGHLGGGPEYAGADAIVSALKQLTTLPELQRGNYEARLLTIPRPRQNQGATFSVIWLKSDPGGADFIYTLPSTNPSTPLPFGLREVKLYPADVFMELIRPTTPLIAPTSPPSR